MNREDTQKFDQLLDILNTRRKENEMLRDDLKKIDKWIGAVLSGESEVATLERARRVIGHILK